MVPSTFGRWKTPFESENRGPNPIWLLPINTNIVSQKSRNRIVQSIYDANNKAPKKKSDRFAGDLRSDSPGNSKNQFFQRPRDTGRRTPGTPTAFKPQIGNFARSERVSGHLRGPDTAVKIGDTHWCTNSNIPHQFVHVFEQYTGNRWGFPPDGHQDSAPDLSVAAYDYPIR